MGQPEPIGRWGRMLLAALLALGLLARLALAMVIGDRPPALPPDARLYAELGLSIAAGEGFGADAFPGDSEKSAGLPVRQARKMPGYPLLVAAADSTGATGRALAAFQSVLGGATMLLAMAAAWRLAGFWAGLAAVALLAFDPYQVFFCALVSPQAALGMALTAAVAAGLKFLGAVEGGSRRTWPWAAAAGLALAAATYFEATAAGFAVLAGLAALLAKRRKRFLAGWAIGAAVLVVCLAPWMVRNAIVVGSPVLTTDCGERLYHGTSMACPCGWPGGEQTAGKAQGLDETAQDVFYLRSALEQIAENPAEWLTGAAGRIVRMWSPEPAAEEAWLPLPPLAGYTSLVPTAALALAGAWALRRRRSALVWLLLAPMYATMVCAVLGGGVENRVAALPLLAALGGVGLAAVLGKTARPGNTPRPGESARPGNTPRPGESAGAQPPARKVSV